MIIRFVFIVFALWTQCVLACEHRSQGCYLSPIASFEFNRDEEDSKKIFFDGTKSYDPNPGSKSSDLRYLWKMGGSGSFQVSTSSTSSKPIYKYESPGTYKIILTVTNIKTKKSSSVTKTITVGATANSIEFNLEEITIAENSGEQNLLINLPTASSDVLNVKISIQYQTASPNDHEKILTSIMIPKGATNATVIFKPVDDKLIETTESLTITIDSVSNTSVSIGKMNKILIKITDDDSGTPPCNGAAGTTHVNADGTAGGFVSSDSVVDSLFRGIIPSDTQLCNRSFIGVGFATFSGKVVLSNTELRNLDNAKISGQVELTDSVVYGRFSMDGNVKVQNSTIYNILNNNFEDPSYLSIKGTINIENSTLGGGPIVVEGNDLKVISINAQGNPKILGTGEVASTSISDTSEISGTGFNVIGSTLKDASKISGTNIKVERSFLENFAKILDESQVDGPYLQDNAVIKGRASVRGNGISMSDSSEISGESEVIVDTSASLRNNALITDRVKISASMLSMKDNSMLLDQVSVSGNYITMFENARVQDSAKIANTTLFGSVKVIGESSVIGSTLCFDETIDENLYNKVRCNRDIP